MKKAISVVLCLCLLTICFAGCSNAADNYVPTCDALVYEENYTGETVTHDKEEENQSLMLPYYPDRTLNPYKSTDFTNRALFSLLYQSLFVTGRDYLSQPQLCKTYKVSEDMKSYTFYIEKATFSNNTPLTIQDVLASLEEAKKSDYYGGRFQHIVEMSVTEDGGLLIQTDTAFENLPILLDIPIIKAVQLEEDRPLGTGPYVFDGNAMGASLRRRQDWWCDAEMTITADTIALMAAESVTHIRDQFEFGDLSLVCADPGSDRYADYRCDFELWDCENGIFLYLACNQLSEVFSNAEVRAALTHAIDRDTLAKDYYRGFARGASLPASPLSPYYSVALAEKYDYNSIKFAQAVSDAGLKESKVVLLVNREDSLRLRVARAIGKMLEECGLAVEMKELAGSAYRYALTTWDYDLYLGQTKLSPNMDLSAFFSAYGALSYGGINDVAAYTLCQQALENHGNYYTLHKTVMDSGLLCPVLFRSYSVYAVRGLLTSLTPSRDNVFYYSLGKTMESALIK